MKISFPQQAFLLFLLNLADAVLTIFWIRNGFATEGNHLMATLLDMGDFPFLGVKIAIGGVTAFTLWRWQDYRIARYGLNLSLAIYLGLMLIHFVTGLSAAGLLSESFISNLNYWTNGSFS